ncbi:MAG: PilZ domain-containing protein [Sphingomonadales bacterium]|nr:PilZ domain-containing protein [Sphingomonadales bacterium]
MKQEIIRVGAEVAAPAGVGGLEPGPPGEEEQRSAPRFTLVLRTARLLADGREYLCVLRDISASGVKIRLFHPLPRCEALELEFEDGLRHRMDVVWCADDHAGLRFAEAVDVPAVLEGRCVTRPRRQMRINVAEPVTLFAGGATVSGRITNLSQQGVCLETEATLSLRERLRLVSDLLPEMVCTVCWRRKPHYGLVFETGFRLDELARLLARLQETKRRAVRGARR